MPPISASAIELLPFALLLAAVFGLWIHRAVWIGALIASIAAAYYTGAMQGLAVLWLGLLAIFAIRFRMARDLPRSGQATALQVLFGIGTAVLTLAIALLILPGFPRLTLTEAARLTPDALPYGIGLGFSKVAPAILILGIINTVRVRSWRELFVVLRRGLPIWMVTVATVIMLTMAMGYVRFEPKWMSLFLVWAVVNLFFTCLSEEAFFRGFVQHELARAGSNTPRAALVAISMSAVLFGLAHFAGGWTYVIAGIVAGAGYGLAYHLTARIEAAMAVHFALNATHFLLFTYPALA
jgi:membrane protease YdiL (CAAX protease family)